MSTRSITARLAADANRAHADLIAAYKETVAIEARDGAVNCETLCRSNNRAFTAASAAAHLPSGSACMATVQKVSKLLEGWGFAFTR